MTKAATHPNAHYILVGYSLGGLIAFDYINRYTDNYSKIKGVITLNAPLTGSIYNIPSIFLDILQYTGSTWGSTAVKQMFFIHQFNDALVEPRKEAMQRLQKNGIRIATFATKQDLVVPPYTAHLINANNQPITEGSIISVSRLGKFPVSLYGHRQILEADFIAEYIFSMAH